MIRLIVTCFLMGLAIQPLFSQQKIIKDFADSTGAKTFCFYPSTLRMINIQNDPNFNEVIADIDKLLFYQLDSASMSSRSYVKVIETYQDRGFEEYLSMWGGRVGYIFGREGRNPAIVGAYGDKDQAFMFYLSGSVNWQKLPTILDSFRDNEIINLVMSPPNAIVIDEENTGN